jgi:predicted DNA-binding protein with PD1-like motif
MIINRTTAVRVLMGKLPKGADLLEALTDVCRRENVRLAKVEALGAVRRAQVGFYDQTRRAYETMGLDGAMEILSLSGNVSLRDDAAVVHIHAIFGDRSGRAYGGHVMPGCEVFACEYAITVLEGAELSRAFDEATGLPLWKE